MMFPDYARVERKFVLEDDKTGVECSYFMVFLQGYKAQIGFRIHRSRQKMNGLRVVDYSFQRYGWSTGLLRWRSKEFRRKVSYLESFFKNSDKDKIDDFLFRENKVIVEKAYKWPGEPELLLLTFDR